MKESSENKLICKPIKDGYFMPFIWMTKEYGHAEFTICPQWKRGKLVRLSIYPTSQADTSYYYLWEGVGKINFKIQSYEGLNNPDVWKHFFCKEHKCHSMRVYVPNKSKYIWLQVYSDNITLGFTKNKFEKP